MFKRLAAISLVVLLCTVLQTEHGQAANHVNELIQQYQALQQVGKYRDAERPAKKLLAIREKNSWPRSPKYRRLPE